MISLEDDIAQSMEQALLFGAILNGLTAPTSAQLWLEQAAAQLKQERDPNDNKKTNAARLKIEIMERDGSDCWFCAKPLSGDVTLEHLQPLALGGNWGLGNLALAHRGCNKAAGHLSRIKKEHLRDEMQSTRDGERANNASPSDQ